MTVTIHYDGDYSDQITFVADSIEEARVIAFAECDKREWEKDKCWSEIN